MAVVAFALPGMGYRGSQIRNDIITRYGNSRSHG